MGGVHVRISIFILEDTDSRIRTGPFNAGQFNVADEHTHIRRRLAFEGDARKLAYYTCIRERSAPSHCSSTADRLTPGPISANHILCADPFVRSDHNINAFIVLLNADAFHSPFDLDAKSTFKMFAQDARNVVLPKLHMVRVGNSRRRRQAWEDGDAAPRRAIETLVLDVGEGSCELEYIGKAA